MTLTEVFKQAQALSIEERHELIRLLMASVTSEQPAPPAYKTGAEIAAMIEAMERHPLVDDHITDPVEWVKAQRQKAAERLKPYWDDPA